MCATAGFSQDAKASIKISRVDVKLEAQFTPLIQASNIVDKRWRPKQWLEVQVDFKSAIARALGGREGTYPSLEIKYFLAFAGVKSADGKQVVGSGTINYKDVAADESHALGFVSPAALKRILQKENGGKADVSVFGVEISGGGEPLAFKSSTGTKFWEAADKISFDECVIPKERTPFAPFWGDFDLQAVK
ncbi:MAG: hypothetical protein JWO89_700 [Verrucomicrobiaceae bacterium]|nr:hypothetical protein [Verrucomicrobiaceae bacterium]MDB6120585.1 hypothetical protein [Verrucomicrobiaceae bacterium]